MSTALDIIKGSLRKLGVIAAGESLSSEEAKDSLEALNDMVESWNTQNLTVPGIKIEEFTLINGQQSYTMGDGGDFDTDIPIKTDSVYLRQSDVDMPLKLISNKEWGELTSKETSSNLPMYVYIDNNYPLRKVYLYPKPSEANTIVFHNTRQLSSFTSLGTTLNLAKGYKRALIYNLAIELAPEYGKSISGEISKVANESLANIKRANIRPIPRKVDPALVSSGGFDWRTGE